MKNIAVVFDLVYNFLYQQEDAEVAMVRLLDFSVLIAAENEQLILKKEYFAKIWLN